MALRIRAFTGENGTFHIHGNGEGLRHLSKIALAIIGQPPGPNHHVVGPGFGADDDSLVFLICYDQELEEGGTTPPDTAGPGGPLRPDGCHL
jgi:hypothetical protein